MKSCFPNPNDNRSITPLHKSNHFIHPTAATTISSLPDDLLLECLSRVPSSSLPLISLVCRRWYLLLLSPSFFNLRRNLHRLHSTLFAIFLSASIPTSTLSAATLSLPYQQHLGAFWQRDSDLDTDSIFLGNSSLLHGFFSQARLAAIGPKIYIIGKNVTLLYDSWTKTITPRSPMSFPRKKFGCAVVFGKIYVAGGSSRAEPTVEEYDPSTDTWRVAAHAPRRRYGCLGASVDGVFYIIGGLKIGCNATAGTEAHVYASSMDLYDVKSCAWLRSRTVPGGGCVVAACAAMGHVYVLTSHAVELSLWRFDARRNTAGFGEWVRIKRPPFPPQVRLDNTVKFSCVGAGDKVVLVQVIGCIDDLLHGSARNTRGLREGLVLIYDTVGECWNRGPDLPDVIRRAAVVNVEW